MDLDQPGMTGRSRVVAAVAEVLLPVLLAAVIGLRGPLFLGNFGVVDPGRAYRSAQPGGDLGATIEARKLGSILNLRGGSDRDAWYVDEVRETARRGVDFYDFPMSATKRPTRGELLTILDVFGRCRYPILIHCKSGSDRTGLAVGLYRMSRLGMPPSEAIGSFSLEYGHVAIGGPEKLHEPIVEYGRWLRDRGLEHSPDRLLGWVRSEYRDERPEVQAPTLLPGPRDRIARRAKAAGPRR